jgi:hypothetical protein
MADTGKDPLPGCDEEEWLGANLKKGVTLFAFCRLRAFARASGRARKCSAESPRDSSFFKRADLRRRSSSGGDPVGRVREARHGPMTEP